MWLPADGVRCRSASDGGCTGADLGLACQLAGAHVALRQLRQGERAVAIL